MGADGDGRREGKGEGGGGGVWLMAANWVAFSRVYLMDEAAASSIHLGLQSSVHSSGICRDEENQLNRM